MVPLLQAVVPAAQTPGLPVLQVRPPPGLPLSTTPSQSLSRPSQISADGCTFWLQTIPPLLQAVVPAAQTPSLPVLQAWPPPGLPLSTTPSQSLSRPSQVSAAGWIALTQTTAPFRHCWVPSAQTPGSPVPQAPPIAPASVTLASAPAVGTHAPPQATVPG